MSLIKCRNMSNGNEGESLLKRGDRLDDTWTIDAVVGQGGCGQVYSLREKDSAHGRLVLKCTALPPHSAKKTLKMREQTNIANSLYYEWFLCHQHFKHFPFVPPRPLDDYGEDKGCRYFVMKRLDYDLKQLSMRAGGLPLFDVCDIGLRILDGLEALHSVGYLFVDVSPSNFMVELEGKDKDRPFDAARDHLFFIDFGLVEKYTEYMLDDKQRDNVSRLCPAGAPRYTSIAVQNGSTPARRDDLESLGYVLLELCSHEGIPWQDASSDAEVLRLKRSADISSLADCCGCPEVAELIDAARGMGYYDPPDYAHVRGLLRRLCPASRQSVSGGSSLVASTYGALSTWLHSVFWAAPQSAPLPPAMAAHVARGEYCVSPHLSPVRGSSIDTPPNSNSMKHRKRGSGNSEKENNINDSNGGGDTGGGRGSKKRQRGRGDIMATITNSTEEEGAFKMKYKKGYRTRHSRSSRGVAN